MYSAVSDFAARQRRIHRAQSATFLSTLDLTGSESGIASISWSMLESVPHWCLLPDADQRTLRLLCGAVFLAPQMHGWIEGRRIQSVRDLIGPEAYDLVLRSTDPLAESISIDEASADMESVLDKTGAAVLLGAIADPQIQSLVATDASRSDSTDTAAALAANIADPLYQRALKIFIRLRQPHTTADESTTANGADA